MKKLITIALIAFAASASAQKVDLSKTTTGLVDTSRFTIYTRGTLTCDTITSVKKSKIAFMIVSSFSSNSFQWNTGYMKTTSKSCGSKTHFHFDTYKNDFYFINGKKCLKKVISWVEL